MARTSLGSPRSPSPTANYHFLLRRTRSPFPHSIASHLMDHRKISPAAASSGKHGAGKRGKAGAGGSRGKKPIKVVYISNPMRVKTSAADFRALVQELTGRHADPSKYGADDEHAASALARQELSPEGSAAASTPDAAVPGPAAAPDFGAAPFGDGDGEEEQEDIFKSQLLDNDYSVCSSPTLLYDYPHGSSSKV